MIAHIFFYVRTEVNRPPTVSKCLEVERKKRESIYKFRERVREVVQSEWNNSHWDSFYVDILT